jgi:hypothetical protein
MDSQKRARLEAAGWKVGDAKDFLNLSAAEAAYVDIKVALGVRLRDVRTVKHLSQSEIAKRLRSSQSRVAKMEAADPSVTIDLLLRSLLELGEFNVFSTLKPRVQKTSKTEMPRKARPQVAVRRDATQEHA